MSKLTKQFERHRGGAQFRNDARKELKSVLEFIRLRRRDDVLLEVLSVLTLKSSTQASITQRKQKG